MSYILEALKKLEQKRGRTGVRHSLTGSTETAFERKRRQHLWPYVVVAGLLLLNAGVLIWWTAPWRPEQSSGPVQPPAVQGRAAAAPNAPAQKGEQDRPVDVKEAPPKTDAGVPVPPSSPPDAAKKAPVVSPPVADKPPATTGTSPPPQAPTEKRAAPDGRVLSLGELPSDVRSSLPELRVSAHYYSAEPRSRFIRVNDQALREGQTGAPGLKLEKITPDGAVFSYQGYRFKMGIDGSR